MLVRAAEERLAMRPMLGRSLSYVKQCPSDGACGIVGSMPSTDTARRSVVRPPPPKTGRRRPPSSTSSRDPDAPTRTPGALSPERLKVEDQIARAKRALSPWMGPDVDGAMDLSGTVEPSGWQGVRDRLRALLGSAASLAATGSAKAKQAARDAASALGSAAGDAARAVGRAAGTLYDDFRAMQRAALAIGGGVVLALVLAAAYLLFSRYGGR
jgi:hypothetical protein